MGYVATIGGGCGAGAVILTLFTTKGGLCCADQNAGPAAWEGPLGPREAINIFSIQLYDQPFLSLTWCSTFQLFLEFRTEVMGVLFFGWLVCASF